MGAYSDAIATLSPVHHWKLDETSGTNAVDSGSGGATGTYTATASLNQSSLIPSDVTGKSVNFNGPDSKLNITGVTVRSTFSFVFTVHLDTVDGSFQIASAQGTVGTAFNGAELVYSDTLNRPLGLNAVAGTTYNIVITSDNLNLICYVDGVATGVTPTASTGVGVEVIGGYSNSSYTLKGAMDEVAVYDKVLTPTEVTTLYDAYSGAPPVLTYGRSYNVKFPNATVDLLDSANHKFDNTTSGLTATFVQAAINELAASISGDLSYTHTQGVASSTWDVTHSLGKFPSITIVDSGGTTVEGDVTMIDINTVQIIFSASFSGKCYCN